MNRKRIQLSVTVDLDPVPGAFHTEDSALDYVRRILEDRIGIYQPKVDYVGEAQPRYKDRAILITEDLTKVASPFFMNNEAVIGWYCVKSEDPTKRDLFLPPHIFRKCFRWIDESYTNDFPHVFNFVEEI